MIIVGSLVRWVSLQQNAARHGSAISVDCNFHNNRRCLVCIRAVRADHMTVVRHLAFTPFRPEQLYDLVNDVGAYPSFLPWCISAVVLAKTEQTMRARLELKKGPLRYSFTTDNRLDHGRSIAMSLVDGPFKRLHGAWRFTPIDGGSTIHLELEFEFANRIAGAALAKAFKPIADSLVDAFKSRAQELYGR